MNKRERDRAKKRKRSQKRLVECPPRSTLQPTTVRRQSPSRTEDPRWAAACKSCSATDHPPPQAFGCYRELGLEAPTGGGNTPLLAKGFSLQVCGAPAPVQLPVRKLPRQPETEHACSTGRDWSFLLLYVSTATGIFMLTARWMNQVAGAPRVLVSFYTRPKRTDFMFRVGVNFVGQSSVKVGSFLLG